jgi:hypothetical protein
MFSASKSKGASGSYQIANSLRFRSSASAYLNRIFGSPTNNKIFTWSGWVKRGQLGTSYTIFSCCKSSGTGDWAQLYFGTDNTLNWYDSVASGVAAQIQTTQVFRDPSSWYHLAVAVDTTQSTSSNRVKLYVNGIQVTSLTTATYYLLNAVSSCNTNGYYGGLNSLIYGGSWINFGDGYMADINFIDGQALTPSSFGQTNPVTGVWQPKAYSGSYGTNGFKLNFSNGTSTTTLGYDSSGNSNNWTTNNISLTAGVTYDWMLDSPTPFAGSSYGVGNYAVLNPLWINSPTISGGNLNVTGPDNTAMASMGMSSGKWYFETTITTVGAISVVGICGTQPGPTNYPYYLSDGYAYIYSGTKANNNTQSAYGATYTSGDIVGVAFDADSGSLTFYKNGVSQGVAYSSIPAKTYYFCVYGRTAGSANNCSANFGQRPFAYTPPSGFKSLCTFNLPAASIVNGASYMAATTYTGTGASQTISNAVNGVSFQPDFVWIKSRSAATDHALYDVIRGTQARLESNTTDAEVTSDNGLTAFGTSGFTVNTLAQVNTNAATYVGWQWKANGTAVSNTAGSITSQVSANTTSGFAVVTYTGTGANATVGHGLGVAPSFIITKNRAFATYWLAYHVSLGNTQYICPNATDAVATSAGAWNNTSPTSTVFSLGSTNPSNYSGNTQVAYCFAAIAGYSAFGSYTGNGSTDGPFIYTGFRPRYFFVKRTDTTGSWWIEDTARSPYNVAPNLLQANAFDAEVVGSSSEYYDILSNGFKARNSAAPLNASGGTYIYAAFCESPFTNALAR